MKTKLFLLVIILTVGLLGCRNTKDAKYKKTATSTITGQVTNFTKCKSEYDSGYKPVITPDSLSCIEYTYDNSNNKLSFKHINAGFNCCPDSLYCNVSVNNDTIIIQELQKKNGCKCNCLYDLDIVLNGVNPQKYQIKFIEPFAKDQEKLIFGIDLVKNKYSIYSVIRKKYPWGKSTNQ